MNIQFWGIMAAGTFGVLELIDYLAAQYTPIIIMAAGV